MEKKKEKPPCLELHKHFIFTRNPSPTPKFICNRITNYTLRQLQIIGYSVCATIELVSDTDNCGFSCSPYTVMGRAGDAIHIDGDFKGPHVGTPTVAVGVDRTGT